MSYLPGRDLIQFGNDNVGAGADIRRLDPGYGSGTASIAPRRVPITSRGNIVALAVSHGLANGNGNSCIYTVFLDDVSTGLTVVLPTGAVVQGSASIPISTIAPGLHWVEVRVFKPIALGSGNVVATATVQYRGIP